MIQINIQKRHLLMLFSIFLSYTAGRVDVEFFDMLLHMAAGMFMLMPYGMALADTQKGNWPWMVYLFLSIGILVFAQGTEMAGPWYTATIYFSGAALGMSVGYIVQSVREADRRMREMEDELE